MKESFYIGKIFQIEIRIHYSWFLIFFLVSFSFAKYLIPEQFPNHSQIFYWTIGIFSASLLFISVFLHELAHSFIAQSQGIKIRQILLFIFGGIAFMEGEIENPSTELKIAIAGPLMSLFLGVLFFFSSSIFPVFKNLAYLNFGLAIFNLVPAFPLDGGRIFRSIFWKLTKDIKKATKLGVNLSKIFVIILLFWGFYNIFNGYLLNGIWLIFIGWFLFQAAQASYNQVILKEILSEIKVLDIMKKRIFLASPEISLKTLIKRYWLTHQDVFPVIEEGKFLGIVDFKRIKNLKSSNFEKLTVKDVMIPSQKLIHLSPTENAYNAFTKMLSFDLGILPVVENEKFLGFVDRNSIFFIITLKKLKNLI